MDDKYKKLLAECLVDANQIYEKSSVSTRTSEGSDRIIKDFALMLFIARSNIKTKAFVFR